MKQITARLSPEKRERFERYAEGLGLADSELARILIVKSLRMPVKLPKKLSAKSGRGKQVGRKLTAHFQDQQFVKKFDQSIAGLGLSRQAIARLIFERELEERWLARAMSWNYRA